MDQKYGHVPLAPTEAAFVKSSCRLAGPQVGFTEPCVFNFCLSIFEEFMIWGDWEREIRSEDLVQKAKHTMNLVEAFMERYS